MNAASNLTLFLLNGDIYPLYKNSLDSDQMASDDEGYKLLKRYVHTVFIRLNM